MGLHLYCILPAEHRPPTDLRGLDDASVEAMDVPPLGTWTSSLPEAPRPTLPRIRAHDRVIRAAVSETVTPLPARFGQWFPDAEALREQISASSSEYEEALGNVAGAVEFGVRIVDPEAKDDPPPPSTDRGPGSGRTYLRTLARRRRTSERGADLVRDLERVVRPTIRRAREVRDEGGGQRGELGQAVHLVERERVSAYREALRGFRESHPELSVHLTGPWPPYSFGP